MTYKIEFNPQTGVMTVGFGDPAQNNQIVRDASARLDDLIKDGTLAGGPL